MTTIKTGVDMVYIPRMISLIENGDSFTRVSKLFSDDEIKCCRTVDGQWRYERLAARFAAKEAVLKAMGTGFSNGLYLHDVSVMRSETGEPSVILSPKAQALFDSLGGIEMSISLTHENDYACAFVVAQYNK